jgi:hypothetical protein
LNILKEKPSPTFASDIKTRPLALIFYADNSALPFLRLLAKTLLPDLVFILFLKP